MRQLETRPLNGTMGIIIDYDAYEDARTTVEKAIEIVAKHYEVDRKKLKWSSFENYCKDVLGIVIVPFGFGDDLSEVLSGSIVSINLITLISYNRRMILERRFFTICHEIVHYFVDLKDDDNHRSFHDRSQWNMVTKGSILFLSKVSINSL